MVEEFSLDELRFLAKNSEKYSEMCYKRPETEEDKSFMDKYYGLTTKYRTASTISYLINLIDNGMKQKPHRCTETQEMIFDI